MPPKKSLLSAPPTTKQKKFKPPFLVPPPPPASPSSAGDSQPSQSQQGDEDITTLGQILESMMKVSKDRRTRRRKDIEGAYNNELARVEEKARKWVEASRVKENRRQLATLTKLRTLLAKKKEIENDILAAIEAMEGACEAFGEVLRRDVDIGLQVGEDDDGELYDDDLGEVLLRVICCAFYEELLTDSHSM